jgi:hypothetical protein
MEILEKYKVRTPALFSRLLEHQYSCIYARQFMPFSNKVWITLLKRDPDLTCLQDPIMAQFPLILAIEPRLLPAAVANGFRMDYKVGIKFSVLGLPRSRPNPAGSTGTLYFGRCSNGIPVTFRRAMSQRTYENYANWTQRE